MRKQIVKLEPFRTYLLKKKGSSEETPFGPESLVFKVMGKIFALLAWSQDPLRVTLKCDPDLALALRTQYEAVQPGYYMNKDHWNTVTLDGSIEDEQILDMVDESYKLVVRGLKKADQQTLQELEQKASNNPLSSG